MTPNHCPYLKFIEESAAPTTRPTGYYCFATEQPFTPNDAHVNSCCTNRATFHRCPFYKPPAPSPPALSARPKATGLLQRLKRVFR